MPLQGCFFAFVSALVFCIVSVQRDSNAFQSADEKLTQLLSLRKVRSDLPIKTFLALADVSIRCPS
ncbi:hypothetical protein R8510_05125 [Ralstonia chuxiongensis]|nr:hypothetical protein R8510_05125 [Ralstonia chuxiongensis]